mgnify:FL=1
MESTSDKAEKTISAMERRKELRNRLRAKIGEQQIERGSKRSKERILEENLKNLSILR